MSSEYALRSGRAHNIRPYENRPGLCRRELRTAGSVYRSMRHTLAALLTVAGMALTLGGARAELTAQEVLDRTLALQDQVQDYTAKCRLQATIPGQEVPERRFTVYFKRPDKVKIVSNEVVFVPREALTLGSLRRHLTGNTDVSMAGIGSFGQYPLYCIKLKPKGDGGNDPGRVLVWIRGDYFFPTKTEIWRGATKLVTIDWTFAWVEGKYWMPTSIVATVPAGILSEEGPATIRLSWSDYRVNSGLGDEVFK